MNTFIGYLSKMNTPETTWLYDQLNRKTDLLDISYGYQDYCKYNGNIMSAIDCAMFEAYSYYKNKTLISNNHALLLKNRDGILGFYYIDDLDEKPIKLTVKKLIQLYDGDNLFHEWLCELSDINYYL